MLIESFVLVLVLIDLKSWINQPGIKCSLEDGKRLMLSFGTCPYFSISMLYLTPLIEFYFVSVFEEFDSKTL